MEWAGGVPLWEALGAGKGSAGTEQWNISEENTGVGTKLVIAECRAVLYAWQRFLLSAECTGSNQLPWGKTRVHPGVIRPIPLSFTTSGLRKTA